jgi:hypothetical protein
MGEGELRVDAQGGSRPVPDPTVLTTEALLREIAALRTLIDQRISASTELFDTKIQLGREGGMALKELFDQRAELNMKMLDERYATQTKALDAAFLAQQAAMTTAFSAAEKAVQAALLAAEKAVEKANVANEKRFEGVNEFRGQLSDLVRTFVPRNEIDTAFKALDTRIGDLKTTVDRTAGGHEATVEVKGDARAGVINRDSLVMIALTVITAIALLYGALHH